MNRRILQFSVAAMLVLAVGGHWVVLQSVAWVRMTVSFSQTAPLEKALKMTFDGEHPCALCKAVKHGKHSERETERRALVMKIDLFSCESVIDVVQPVEPLPVIPAIEHVPSRTDAPPRPPPRSG